MRIPTTQLLATAVIALFANTNMVQGEFLGQNRNGVNMFSINLDLPANQRFAEVSAFYKDAVNVVLDSYLEYIPWLV